MQSMTKITRSTSPVSSFIWAGLIILVFLIFMILWIEVLMSEENGLQCNYTVTELVPPAMYANQNGQHRRLLAQMHGNLTNCC
ncbi:hypothetical protein KP509_30G005400 [Ceratopteris richardii]|uniref:Uncharacterized protein n=1 Tax=Ceratopteris richardii TaxID=49495 RepID=A0A8T2QZQ6_CERRI|nr:hypothetical protein KP509_30G005400 [Ceratopteris richardii]